MQRKRPMLLRRAWDMVAVSAVIPLEEVVRRRIAVCGGGGRSVLFKRHRRLSLSRRYDLRFSGERQFSPDSTPLFPQSARRGRLLRLLLCGGTAAADDDDDGGGDASVDQRAESFIQWFYEEMRTQTQQENCALLR
ncbi:unnamed protein product [Spirodela intermedia]|uniref:Uncharacterized protein n=1 Tax=Spirodela intermedia TaxID=51605 RepID=A0A7I8ITI6_SPIIN|nr:unnamed protein product [Spirodela intermedia]CAA6661314.1 unnamed protein product [Spirodela intermedia]